MAVGSVFGNGKEISYTRAIVSATPFVGLFVFLGNVVSWAQRMETINKDAGEQRGKSRVWKDQTSRNAEAAVAYARLAIASAVATIVIFVALAATGKMKVSLVALSIIPCITITLAGLWMWGNKKDIARHQKLTATESLQFISNLAKMAKPKQS